MNRVAVLPARERSDLFREAAWQLGDARGMNPAVVEKDFWVCWVLKQLFEDPELKDRMVFKGGTTLSKCYQLIERFSEDIDLILDWRLLGYGAGQRDPFEDFGSNTKQDKFNKQFNAAAAAYISTTLVGQLGRMFGQCQGVSAPVDPSDGHTINVAYPAAFAESYLRPEVRLEIGPLGSWIPSSWHDITPYAATAFPAVFKNPVSRAATIAAERTFWEKAAILHQEAHRTGPVPPRYSRHYYDLYRLARSPVKAAALGDTQLLRDVVAFKRRFYPAKWANYESAIPGSFKLMPAADQLADLRRDYRGMAVMFFGETPAWDDVVDTLQKLEDEINQPEVARTAAS